LNLDVLSIVRLAALLLSVVITVYLLRVPGKSLATLFLAGVFFGATLFNAASFFEFAGEYYWQPRTLRTVLVLLFNDVGPSLGMVFLLLFAYHFPHFRRVERKEFRVTFSLSLFLNAGVLGLNIYNHFILQWHFSDMRLWDIYWLVFYCSLVLQFLGAIALLFRKAARLSGHGTLLQGVLRPRGRDAESARALGVSLLLPVVAVASALAMTYGVLPFVLATYLTWLGLLLFYLSFILTYFAHSRDPTTLQGKVIGVTLVLVLGLMGIVALFVGQAAASDYPRVSPLPEKTTVRFTLTGAAGYDVRRLPIEFDPDLGQKADLSYGRSFITRMQFDFPFFAGHYRSLHILNGPMVYLGEDVRENGWGGYNPQPAIAPIIMNLDPSRKGGVFLKSTPGAMTVTWFRLPELGADNENTIQLVLRSDGTIDMSFERLSPSCAPSVEQLYNYNAASTTGGDPAPGGRPAPFPPRLTGIHPGGRGVPLVPVSFTSGLPWSSAGPAVIFESHEAGFAHHLNQKIGVLAAMTVAACILVLVLIPILLRTSLFLPLQALAGGMRRVEAGALDAAVKVRSSDEIGSLARSFNRMTESIARAESSFRALAEDARDGIVVFRDEAAVYANRRAAEMSGYAAAGLTGTRFETFLRRTTLPAFGVQPEAPAEALLITSEGREFPVEIVFSHTLWLGRPAVAVLLRDITQRKREEETAQRQQQNLMRMDKLTSLGVLAAGLAHEISVPNQAILSHASILERASPQLAALLDSAAGEMEGFLISGLEVSEFQRRLPEILGAITKGAALIDGVIQNLREFSAESPGPGASPFDLNAAIRSAMELLGPYIRRATDRFTVDLQPGLPRARGSARRLQQVFINLILNACQSLAGREKAVTVRSICAAGSLLRVTVHDEGVGIPADVLPHVREQFFTTRESSGGTGLGLFVCQEIVTAHGGTLELTSQPGVGTEVAVILPAEVEP
jgi:PAS domain S-box-containing protein